MTSRRSRRSTGYGADESGNAVALTAGILVGLSATAAYEHELLAAMLEAVGGYAVAPAALAGTVAGTVQYESVSNGASMGATAAAGYVGIVVLAAFAAALGGGSHAFGPAAAGVLGLGVLLAGTVDFAIGAVIGAVFGCIGGVTGEFLREE